MVGGRSLFSVQVEETNKLLYALKLGKQRNKTWVLLVTFNGAIHPGWQPLSSVDYLDAEQLSESRCSPILDLLAGICDICEGLVVASEGFDIRCGMMIATDGLDGFTVESTAYPVSISTVEEVHYRVKRFCDSGYFAYALAIGPDGGDEVASFFDSLGFSKAFIGKAGLDPQGLRRAFADMSESSLQGLNL